MSRVTDLLEAKLNMSPDKLSIDDVMDLAKKKRAEGGHDCCILVTFKSDATLDDSYGVSVFGLQDADVYKTLLDLAHLFYEMK
jgi:hypothetical protein